jgi:hypothetical protein
LNGFRDGKENRDDFCFRTSNARSWTETVTVSARVQKSVTISVCVEHETSERLCANSNGFRNGFRNGFCLREIVTVELGLTVSVTISVTVEH